MTKTAALSTGLTITRTERTEIYAGTFRFYAYTIDAQGKEGIHIYHGSKTETKCGARCQNSLGPSCDCSCAGENHGATYRMH